MPAHMITVNRATSIASGFLSGGTGLDTGDRDRPASLPGVTHNTTLVRSFSKPG